MPSHIYDLQDTWNAGGVVFNGIKIDVNNAASAVGSRLLRVDTAGVSQFAVDPVNGAVVGAATGGPKGPGTLNATGLYINGNLLGGVADGDKGDITVSVGGTVWTIDPAVVTYAKIQNVSVTGRVLGRFSAGAGPIEEGTGAQVNTLLPLFTDTLKGLVPPSGGGTVQFLRADGTFATPPGGGGAGLSDAYQVITDGAAPASAIGAGTFKLRAAAPLAVATENVNATHGKNALFSFVAGAFGDITISAGAWTISNDAVTYAKMQNVSAQSLLIGRGQGAGGGDPQEITLGTNLTMSGTTLNATGGGGGGGFTNSSTAPLTPVVGDRWYNLDTGVTSTYVNDGNTSQWVQSGPSVAPAVAAGFAGVNVQTFTASGTYTPTVGMKYCQIECVGGGGGGGGVGDSSGAVYGGAGGGSGGYAKKTVNAAAIGASQVVTVGAAGAAATGSAGTTTGGTGGVTSVGTLCIANGGAGGPGSHAAGSGAGGLGGAPGTGDIAAAGNPGGCSYGTTSGGPNAAGNGGASFFGGGGRGAGVSSGGTSVVGGTGLSYGGGGGGSSGLNTATGRPGGAGAPGVATITEYF